MLLQCRLHISHPLVQPLTQLALSKMEFLELIVGPFEGAIVVEAAHSHLIDHRLANQILLCDCKVGVTERTLALLGNAGRAKRMGTRMEPHRIPHHLLAFQAVQMLGIGRIDKLELAARLFLHFLDCALYTSHASCLAHIQR